jgi:hypothetical protein
MANETAGKRRAPGAELPDPDFSTFLISLWTTALFQMGQLPDPSTGQPIPPDMPMASQTIETLKMLCRKTEGNLSHEEVELFDKILYELHMKFVELGG